MMSIQLKSLHVRCVIELEAQSHCC